MSIRLLALLLLVAQLLIGLAALAVLAVFVVHVIQGGPFTTDWPVVAQSPVANFPFADKAGAIRVDRGTLALTARDWKPEFVQLLCVWLFAIGANVAIARLKAALAAIAAGHPFDAAIVRGLRLIGYLMLGWIALDIADALVAEPLILAAAHPAAHPAGQAVLLGSSISRPHGALAAQIFRLDFHLDLLKIAAGLFALALGQAFAIGRRLADDNESIV